MMRTEIATAIGNLKPYYPLDLGRDVKVRDYADGFEAGLKAASETVRLHTLPPPEPGESRLCLVCAHVRPWGVFSSETGAVVCKDCRDGARLIPQLTRLGEQIDILASKLEKAREIVQRIVCTEKPDDGVVLLSNDGPCHWDEEVGCQVYDHEHFSPLGDALMELWKTIQPPTA